MHHFFVGLFVHLLVPTDTVIMKKGVPLARVVAQRSRTSNLRTSLALWLTTRVCTLCDPLVIHEFNVLM